MHNVDLDGLREGLPSLHLPPHPPKRTDPDAPVRSANIRAIRWAQLGDGDRRPCPGCGRHKYFDDFDLDHIVPRAKGGHRRRRQPAAAVLAVQPDQGPDG